MSLYLCKTSEILKTRKNKRATASQNKITGQYVKDLAVLFNLKRSQKFEPLAVDQFPFDIEMLTASQLYRQSRLQYLNLGGAFKPKLSSMMRSLRAQDLFKDEIDFTPSRDEMVWFLENFKSLENPYDQVQALKQFNENSLFHEQNHRTIWRILPPAPIEKVAFRRYLNFAESLVVMLDLALGDQLGRKLSPRFERMNVIYRPSGHDGYPKKSKGIYRHYLLSLFLTTYYALELIHHDDILPAVNYVFPNQKALNKKAVQRGLELSELFTLNTNPQWQNLYWKQAQKSLQKLNQQRTDEPFFIAADPLDLGIEFSVVRSVLIHFGL